MGLRKRPTRPHFSFHLCHVRFGMVFGVLLELLFLICGQTLTHLLNSIVLFHIRPKPPQVCQTESTRLNRRLHIWCFFVPVQFAASKW